MYSTLLMPRVTLCATYIYYDAACRTSADAASPRASRSWQTPVCHVTLQERTSRATEAAVASVCRRRRRMLRIWRRGHRGLAKLTLHRTRRDLRRGSEGPEQPLGFVRQGDVRHDACRLGWRYVCGRDFARAGNLMRTNGATRASASRCARDHAGDSSREHATGRRRPVKSRCASWSAGTRRWCCTVGHCGKVHVAITPSHSTRL